MMAGMQHKAVSDNIQDRIEGNQIYFPIALPLKMTQHQKK